jgi:hypothetical protein
LDIDTTICLPKMICFDQFSGKNSKSAGTNFLGLHEFDERRSGRREAKRLNSFMYLLASVNC